MTRTARPKVPATSPTPNHLPTSFLLLAQYGGRAFIPLTDVCRDFFAHFTPEGLARKALWVADLLARDAMEACPDAHERVMTELVERSGKASQPNRDRSATSLAKAPPGSARP